MMSSAVMVSDQHAEYRSLAAQPWIISLRDDLLWFQGSVLAGVVLLLFFWLQPPLNNATYTIWNPVVMVLLLWGVMFDGTPVWGTYARSYRASDEASRATLPGPLTSAIIADCPAWPLIDYAFLKPGTSLLSNAGGLYRTVTAVA